MGGSFAFLALAIASVGYILATRCYLFRYSVSRQSGHKLYLTSITLGFLVMAVAMMVMWLFGADSNLRSYPFKLSFITLIIGFGASELYNRKVPDAKEKALIKAWDRDDLEDVIAYSVLNKKPFSVTLETRKVYVGFVARTLEPSDDKSHLSLIPIYSGFRREPDLGLELTHRYDSIIRYLAEKESSRNQVEYTIVIPLERIVSANIFNEDLYKDVTGNGVDSI